MHLVVLDVETTGTAQGKDHVIQFSAIKVDTKQHRIIGQLSTYVQPVGNYTIGIGAYLKHRITPAILKDAPHFGEIAQQILNFLEGCAILTYNGISFDLPFLITEFKRVGMTFRPSDYKLYDAFREERRRNGNTLEDTFHRYCGRTMEEAGLKAHDALSDIKATYAVFRHQWQQKPFEPEKIVCDDDSVNYQEVNGVECLCFTKGKYRDVPVSVVGQADKSYISWFLMQDIPPSTRELVNKEIGGQ